MTTSDRITFRRGQIASTITIVVAILGSSYGIIKTIAKSYGEVVMYVQHDKDEKEAIVARQNATDANLAELKNQVQGIDKQVQKHETFFDYLTNKPMQKQRNSFVYSK
jgi:hypothetical protein